MTSDGEVRCWLVRGQVQGVGFRVFVFHEARKLRLRGTVRNASDGAVDVIAAGPVEELNRLEERLRVGPDLAEVHSVEPVAHDGSPEDLPATFMIAP